MTSTVTTIDQVKDLFAAFSRGDVPHILNHLTPDCQWTAPGAGIPAAGHYTGPAGAGEFFQKLAASEEVTRFEPREFFTNAAGDVVAHGFEECRIISNGRMVSTPWMMVFRFRDGKVASWEAFYDTAAYATAHLG
ncbi:MAG: nuclear transport factor 2 family protein [Bryobacteraceae bacterium]|nr:nuclear transport factor 2 family protein [Bryobacteraceae bacterium]